jgi:hypothetical protein
VGSQHSLSTPGLTHERTPHQAMWLYQMVVAKEEVTFVINMGGKDFMYFLWLLVMMKNYACCIHVNTLPGSNFHVWMVRGLHSTFIHF